MADQSPEIKGKVPPQNVEAEQSLLGSILIDPNAMDKSIPIIKQEDFYDPRHIKIFTSMRELHERGDAIDALTLSEALRIKGWLESVGGASYISQLSDTVPTAAHVEEYATIVKDKAILRGLIELSTSIIENSFKEQKNPEQLLEHAESKIFAITERNQRTTIKTVKEMISEVYEQIKMRGRNPDALIGLETGFTQIDNFTSGLKKGELVIIAARPSLGKTSLAINIAYNLAIKRQKGVLVFSLEMSGEDLTRRLLAYGSSVSLQKLMTGKFISRDEDGRMMHVAGELSGAQIHIDSDDNDVVNMKSKARTLAAKMHKDGRKLDLIIVDYMQLVRPNMEIKSREQQIAHISRSLKGIARELEVPVIALSQLNREPEKRERVSKKGESTRVPPRLSDLRESGSIEQDADIVMFIDREEDEEVERETSSGRRKTRKCKLIISKNRNGPTGDQLVYFIPELTAFVERSGREGGDEYEEAGPEAFT